jgi:hypothetical protein
MRSTMLRLGGVRGKTVENYFAENWLSGEAKKLGNSREELTR